MAFGNFKGNVSARWLTHSGDDRNMQLLDDFSYTDPDGHVWKAPKGSIINGASIPAALWSSIGPPFVGDYRRASVVHDVACEERKQPHDRVHLMFYHAMRADGVGWIKANTMYQAVKRFGPRWGSTGRLSRRQATASDESIRQFAEAVQQAAAETDESQGLDAVEVRVDEIMAAELGNQAADKRSSSATKSVPPGSQRRTASRIGSVKRPRAATAPKSGEAVALQGLAPAIRKQLAGARGLRSFRRGEMSNLSHKLFAATHADLTAEALGDPTLTAGPFAGAEDNLSDADRLRLVDQALVLIEQNYVHRPLKESLYAVNPVQKLRLLREAILRRLQGDGQDDQADDLDFHRELLTIFLSVRDLHTNYLLPSPFADTTAFLPFLVEDYFDPSDQIPRRRFLVTRVVGDSSHGGFAPGVEIIRWNGVPIERAAELNGERFAGSNKEASRARGLETLTVRPLLQALPPEEDFVLVEYRSPTGQIQERRFEWMIFSPDTGNMAALQELDDLTATAQGIDLEQTVVRWVKRILFAPEAVATAAKMAKRTTPLKSDTLASLIPDVLQAKTIAHDGEEYGYIRIRTFSVNNADSFVREFIRLAEQLPRNGLIIDVRGNGGGLILAGEQLLQVLTPREIQPTLFQILSTPLNRQLVEEVPFLSQWKDSMRQAVQTGAPFSQGFPITSPAKANDLGQRYYGPVVLITDALCYSTTDIFAAGFQDHEIGLILGIDNNTGAGGANVWTHGLLQNLLGTNARSPYEDLPSNANMRVSMRRTIRTGLSNGTVLEDFGVVPDELHRMTRDDLLNDNPDLIARAAEFLVEQPTRYLAATVETDGDQLILTAETEGIDRLDIYANDRPQGTVDVSDGTTEITLPIIQDATIYLRAYESNTLVAVRTVNISA